MSEAGEMEQDVQAFVRWAGEHPDECVTGGGRPLIGLRDTWLAGYHARDAEVRAAELRGYWLLLKFSHDAVDTITLHQTFDQAKAAADRLGWWDMTGEGGSYECFDIDGTSYQIHHVRVEAGPLPVPAEPPPTAEPIPTNAPSAPTEGWLRPINSRQFHYFQDDGRSLCARWFMFSLQGAEPEREGYDTTRDCADCRKKLARRKPEPPPTAELTGADPARGREREE